MKNSRKWAAGCAAAALAVAGGTMVWRGAAAPTASVAAAPSPSSAAPAADAAPRTAGGLPAADDAPALEFAAREVVRPVRQRLDQVLEFSGPLVAPQTAVLRAKAGGTLLALGVAEGDRVRAGQVLGRIDMAEAQSRAAERAAQLGAARSALAQAERSHAGNERLAAQGFISPIALEASRTALASAQSAVEAAQAALDTTRAALRDAQLLAPIAGIVSRRQALPGEKVSPEQPLLTLVDLGRLELAAQVGTHQVARLAVGLPVQLQVEGLAQPLAGRVARIAPAAEPGTRAIGVTVALDNPGERLRAGQYALGRVTLADDTERLVLPATAVQAASAEPYVWVIEDGRLARRSIVLGRRDDAAGLLEVRSGLAPQAQVLGARFDNLREGRLARVAAEGAAEGTAVGAVAAAGALDAPGSAAVRR
jgi:RND family efflux transporter MFP subunit